MKWLKTNYKYLIIILLVIAVIGPIWNFWAGMIYADIKSRVLRSLGKPEVSIGNMNGVELTIPKAYQEWPVSYSGEDDWKPLKNPPERTYRSGINHFSLIAKWPNMEHRYQGNNYESYQSRREINGSKDWISFSVVSRFVNWSPAQIEQRLEEKGHPERDYSYFLSKRLEGKFFQLPSGNRYVLQGVDAATGLNYANVIGPDASKPRFGNRVIYWHVNEQKITTYIECSGPLIQRLEPLKTCEQRFDLPELHAEVVVHYYLLHLPQWRKIEDKTSAFILSLKRSPTSN